jgi:hypothetical protein
MADCLARQGNGHGMGPHQPDTPESAGLSDAGTIETSTQAVSTVCPLSVIPLFLKLYYFL